MSAQKNHESLGSGMLMLIPQRQTISPKDYGMNYREVEFTTPDELVLRGWLINESANKTIIMTHFGCRTNRFGYQPKHPPYLLKPYKSEIEFYSVAKHLVKAGYSVLMYDLRNQGQSDEFQPDNYNGDTKEPVDLVAAIEFIVSESSPAGKPIGLLSYSVGANISFLAMQKHSDAFIRCGVKAMVAVQPLSVGDPLNAIHPERSTYRTHKAYSKIHVSDPNPNISLEEAAKSVCIPTRLVQAKGDPFSDITKIVCTFDNIPVEKEMLWLDSHTHRFDGYNWFSKNPQDMLGWFEQHLL